MFKFPTIKFKKTKKQKTALIVQVAAVLFIFILWFVIALQPFDSNAVEIEKRFVVDRGDGLREITANLVADEIIKSSKAFKLYSLLRGAAHRFKPGIYKLSPSWNSAQIIQLLVAGPAEKAIFIPEGATLKDIDARLTEEGIIEEGELINFNWQHLKLNYPFLENLNSLEGFLFPDTYRFAQFSPIEVVVREMLSNFSRKAWPYLENRKDYHDKMVAASLIEKEAPFSSDRKLISGIIYKRISLGMPLQIDATVAYAKCEERFLTCAATVRRLVKSDLAIDNIFNTYLNKGLPPAPIANFGIDALKAAVTPQSSNYLYYVSDPRSKRTIFAATLDEHNNNRVKYLR